MLEINGVALDLDDLSPDADEFINNIVFSGEITPFIIEALEVSMGVRKSTHIYFREDSQTSTSKPELDELKDMISNICTSITELRESGVSISSGVAPISVTAEVPVPEKPKRKVKKATKKASPSKSDVEADSVDGLGDLEALDSLLNML